MKTPRDMAKISDADWAASDRPILALNDGTVRVMDLMFRCASAPMEESQLPGKGGGMKGRMWVSLYLFSVTG